MKLNRKLCVVVLGILILSLLTVSAEPGKATIHVQTYGYEGRDVVTLTVEVTGEDSDCLYIAVDPKILDKIKNEINIEKLPVIQVSETMYKVPRIYLMEVSANEYTIVVPNDVTKMKWSIRDQIKDMNRNDVVSVLVWFKDARAFSAVKKHGVITYEFLSGLGAAVDIRVSNIKALSEEAAIEFVEADGISYIALSQSVPLINADDVWGLGYDGTGTSICIIDTGIDPNHCDFPPGKIIAWADYVGSSSTPYDDHGHGTAIASIAAGADSPYGVAPGASLMGAKVCNAGGSCSESAIIQGIEFGVAQGADVENLSLGAPGGDGTSAVAQVCNWAVDQGVVVVCAAGNDGPSLYTINTPGDAENVITVGACDKFGNLADSSSRGPTTDERKKPDVVAPGVYIYTADDGTPCDDDIMSGTSMAAPHVAGVAALMKDANSSATSFDIKGCICATAIDEGDPGWDPHWGWGRVDALEAVYCILSSHTVTITNPVDGSHIHKGETVNITVSTSGYINKVKFYISWIEDDNVEGEFLCTDTTAPFECPWDTTDYTERIWYTIRVDGYLCDQVKDVDEITVYLLPPSSTFHPTRTINSDGVGLGTFLVSLLVFFGSVGIMTRTHIREVLCHAQKVNIGGKKGAALTLVMLLSLNIPGVLSSADTLTVEYQFGPALINECGSWMVEDTHIREIPGEPLIPYRTCAILLPQDAVVKDIKVKCDNPIVQTGIDIPWGQPPCTFSDEPVVVGRNEEIYSSNDVYPEMVFETTGVNYFRGYAILNLNLFPVQYMPKSGTVKFYETMTVEVKLGKGLKNELYRGLEADKVAVSDIVDNPEMTGTYEDVPQPLATEEYIIITNDTMQSTFQTLANYKSTYVNGATVYTVSWITANYGGVDNQDKIRNFIIDKYTNNGLKWCLLGGDTAAVPYRGFYVSTGGYTDSDMLADMYFSHLDGSHNSDGDSRYGETNDNVDFYAEIAVGRAPCQNVTEATAFVNKVIAYEQAPKPERICLHQSRVQPGNYPDSRCLAWNCDDYIPGGYTIDYVFEENGTVSKTVWRNAWAAGPIAVVHIGHGNTNVYHINYEVGGTVSWYNSDVSNLTNTFFPWTTSVACITGEIEANDCLAEAYVMDPDNGAIAALYNDNYGWFSTLNACQYSGEFCEMEVRACWNDGKEKLGEMLNKARSYLVSSAQSNSYYRWCFYERNLVGDPESPCLTQREEPTVTITNPSNEETICATVNITTSTAGCIDTVEFYIDGVLRSTDTTSPFSWSWETTEETEGSHTIETKGYCSGVYKDNDSANVTVNNKIIITNPEDEEHVNGTVHITTSASQCVETVKFYLIWIEDDDVVGELMCTDTTAPFECTWVTTGYIEGMWYTIRADAYWGGKVKDVDEITVLLCPPSSSLHPTRIFTPKGVGLGTMLVALLILLGSVGMARKRQNAIS